MANAIPSPGDARFVNYSMHQLIPYTPSIMGSVKETHSLHSERLSLPHGYGKESTVTPRTQYTPVIVRLMDNNEYMTVLQSNSPPSTMTHPQQVPSVSVKSKSSKYTLVIVRLIDNHEYSTMTCTPVHSVIEGSMHADWETPQKR